MALSDFTFLFIPAAQLLLAVVIVYTSYAMFFTRKWDPKGLHAYVTGGSQGLGLALAILLAKKGAHVSIVARDQGKLDKALAQLEANRQNPDQIFKAYSFSLDSAQASAAALTAASKPHGGRVPDAIFACAGSSKPMYFLEMEEQDMINGMVNGYWVQAWTAFAAAKEMVRQGRKGKICFVSSTLGYMSLIGWASYSPAKHALRGLADTLRSEFNLYDVDVHIYFPATIYSPGFEEENKTKPALTLKIESADEGVTPEQAAQAFFAGVEKGEFHIAGDMLTRLFRASTRGASPRSNALLEFIFDIVAFIGVPIWRRGVDKMISDHRLEHQEHLKKGRFFGNA